MLTLLTSKTASFGLTFAAANSVFGLQIHSDVIPLRRLVRKFEIRSRKSLAPYVCDACREPTSDYCALLLSALIKVSFDLAVIRLIFVVGEWLVEIGQFDSFFSSNGYKIYDFFSMEEFCN